MGKPSVEMSAGKSGVIFAEGLYAWLPERGRRLSLALTGSGVSDLNQATSLLLYNSHSVRSIVVDVVRGVALQVLIRD